MTNATKAKVLVVYGSTEGHTFKLARFILTVIREAGFEAKLANANDLYRSDTSAGFDAVIVGASVHHGAHQTSVSNFVKDSLESLRKLPSAFFSVSLNAVLEDSDHQAEAQQYVTDFLEDTGWQPDRTTLVAGALRNTELDYFRRELARHIVQRTVPETNTSENFDFTDYDHLKAFVSDFLEDLVRLGLRTGPSEAGS